MQSTWCPGPGACSTRARHRTPSPRSPQSRTGSGNAWPLSPPVRIGRYPCAARAGGPGAGSLPASCRRTMGQGTAPSARGWALVWSLLPGPATEPWSCPPLSTSAMRPSCPYRRASGHAPGEVQRSPPGEPCGDPTAVFPWQQRHRRRAATATHRHATMHTRDTARRDVRGCVTRAGEQRTAGPAGRHDEGHTPLAQAVSGSVRTKLGGGRMSVDNSSAGLGNDGSRMPTEREPAGHRVGVSGVCPRCGRPVPVRATGRPARWCSQRCRRAAYEERRAAAAGAVAVEVELVETVTTTEHGLDECVRRVQASPVAVRKVLTHLTKLLAEDGLRDPKWASTVDSAVVLARAVGTGGRSSASFSPRGYVKPRW